MTNAELDTLWSRAEQFSGGFTRYRFAALVAAAERDRMISEGWRQCAKGQKTTQHCGMVEQARLEEREACARVCEGREWVSGQPLPSNVEMAAAIRAQAADRLARHGIQIPEDEGGNPSFG
jgi:hypothetical protein